MNIVSKPSFAESYNPESIRSIALGLVDNYKKELEEIQSRLDCVLELKSPFLIQKFLNDDPMFITQPHNVKGRLMNAKINFEMELNKFYWEYLCSFTTDFFYPKSICNFNPKHFFKSQSSWGVTYEEFTVEKVNEFLDLYLLQPYPEQVVQELISLAKPLMEIHNEIEILPFSVYSNELNSYITAEHVVFALIQSKLSKSLGWLEKARQLKFSFDDFDHKNSEFKLVRSCKPSETHKVGATLSLSFVEFLALPRLNADEILKLAPHESDTYNVKTKQFYKHPDIESDFEYMECWKDNKWVVTGKKVFDIKFDSSFVPLKKLISYSLVDWVGGINQAESILYDTLEPKESGFWYWDIKSRDHAYHAISEFSVHKDDLRKALNDLTSA